MCEAHHAPKLTMEVVKQLPAPDDSKARASLMRITSFPKFRLTTPAVTDRVLLFSPTKATDGSEANGNAPPEEDPHPLAGLCRIEFKAMDQWFLEEEPIYVHPKDPFKRVDIHPSTRKIRVEIDGCTVAESNFSWTLHETSLPTRYYLPKPSVCVCGEFKWSSTNAEPDIGMGACIGESIDNLGTFSYLNIGVRS
jgi:hypothetical protein